MKTKTNEIEKDEEIGLDVSSLIDVCFLLLIYFLVTSTIVPREKDLTSRLPREGEPLSQVVISPLLIQITDQGGIEVGEGSTRMEMDMDLSSRELPLLVRYLKTYVAASSASGDTPMVNIHAGDNCTQQRMIDVLNALAGEGISNVTFMDQPG